MTRRVSNGNSRVVSRLIPLLVIEQAHDSAGIKWESTSGLSLDTLACHSRHRAGISIIRLGLSKKDNLFFK